jgi:hypothetical protein
MALGRRSLLGALAAVGTADFATAASGREDEPGGSGVRVVEVGVEPKVGSFDLYRRGIIPVGVRLPASVDREDLQVRSLRFGPPRVVEAGEGARPERRERDVPVYHFPASEAGFEFGDATGRLAGRTEDGRRLLGETGLPSDGATGIFDPLL